jgi:hypothetical protein
MAKQTINVGAAPNDGTGDTLRDSFVKTNDNFTDVYTNKQDTLVSATNIKTVNGSSILGSGNLVVGGSSGIFGISNSSGVYTYYATLTLAMAAAVSGNVIEMFADVTETGAVTVTIKDGVTINGNNHTYLHTSADITNTFTTAGTGGTFRIYNLNITRTNSTGGYVILSAGGNSAPQENFYFDGTLITCNNTAIYTAAFNTTRKLYNLNIIATGSSVPIMSVWGVITLYDFKVRALSSSTALLVSSINAAYNSIFEHEGSPSGFGLVINTTLNNCVVISRGSTACIGNGVTAYNSTFFCAAGSVAYPYNIVANNCSFISNGAVALSIQEGSIFRDCSIISTANNAFNGHAQIFNCSMYSTSAVAVILGNSNTPLATIENSSIYCGWNNVAGHALRMTNDNIPVKNCSLRVVNTSANCINSLAARPTKYANNSFDGAITSVNAFITQAITNVSDTKGNIVI